MTSAEFSHIAPTLPSNPGIYKYFDAQQQLIYVGKAKNIKKRVSSYFSKTFTSYKTNELVQRIRHIEFTIVPSEHDALLLENSLIKQFQPKFNIDLKDDKTYPYIVIKKEPFPRIFLTRQQIHDGSEYLGPFTSVGKVRELLAFIKQHIPLRTCKLNLSPDNIAKRKFKVCLEYHLGNCKGPCEGLQSTTEYDEGLMRIKHFLKGNLGPIIHHFKEEMKTHAAELQFEKAEIARKKMENLQQFQARSTVVNPKIGNVDVCYLLEGDENKAYVNFLMVRNGAVVDTKSTSLQRKLDEEPSEMLMFAVSWFREKFYSEAKEIILPYPIDYPDPEVTIQVPKAGDKKKLLEMAEKNVRHFISEEKRQTALMLTDKNTDMSEVLLQIQEDLQLQDLPVHIECFDNSNFQGSYPVSAMVCFKEGKPSKHDYRHFNVKSVEGINDFATMKEAVWRRYNRLLHEQKSLPQLVIIDGGKGQLNAALEAIEELGLTGRMTLIGLAKNVEEIFFPGDQESVKLPYQSPSLRLIRFIRDQVHRYGVTFHRKKRSKGTFRNELEDIKGIGKTTAETLLKQFKSVQNVFSAPEDELILLIGPAKTKLIKDYSNPQL
ncbi:MAG: excinuclease ABC subunit UvrC [Sphingobacteriales bacterium]|jgi:excinuclease ABC subunit C